MRELCYRQRGLGLNVSSLARVYARTLRPEKPGTSRTTNLDVLVAFVLGLAVALVWVNGCGNPLATHKRPAATWRDPNARYWQEGC